MRARDLVTETRHPALRPISGDELLTRLDALETENAQLREQLHSCIAIERANGVIAERLEVSIDDAFAVLRLSARGERMPLHELAEQVQPGARTPSPFIWGLAREQRWRALALRERTQASRARTARLRDAAGEQCERLREDASPSERCGSTRYRYQLINSTDGRELGWFNSRRSDWKPGDLVGPYYDAITVTAVVEPEDGATFRAYLVVAGADTLSSSP